MALALLSTVHTISSYFPSRDTFNWKIFCGANIKYRYELAAEIFDFLYLYTYSSKGVSLSRTFKKGTFSQFSLKQKIKTLVKDFSHIFRYIFKLVKKKFSFKNKKKSRTYRRSRAVSHHGQLILRA